MATAPFERVAPALDLTATLALLVAELRAQGAAREADLAARAEERAEDRAARAEDRAARAEDRAEDRAARAEDRAARAEERAEDRAMMNSLFVAQELRARTSSAAVAAALSGLAAAMRPVQPRSSGSGTPPPSPAAGGVAGGAGGGAGGAAGGMVSRLSRTAANELRSRLLVEFMRADVDGLNVDCGDFALPFAARLLVSRGAIFAHRLLLSGGVRHNDFYNTVENNVVFYLPAATGEPPRGQSFFIVLSRDAAVLACAHELRGAAADGCQKFAINALPEELELVVDRTLEGSPDAPAVVHAVLAPRARMSYVEFVNAANRWCPEMEPCLLKAAGGGGAGGTRGSGDDALAAGGAEMGTAFDGGGIGGGGRHAALLAARRAAQWPVHAPAAALEAVPAAAPAAAHTAAHTAAPMAAPAASPAKAPATTPATAPANKSARTPAEERQPVGGSPG